MSDASRMLEVGPDEGGRRLDVFLAERLGLSRKQTRRLLARGAVAVGGSRVAEAAKGVAVRAGETVEVLPFTQPDDLRVVPEPEAALPLLLEGPGWVALDKPPGVAVHPLLEGETGTLLNALVARRPELHGVGEGALRSGVVHRLDVGTSGVVLFATREQEWQRLRQAFSQHRVEKTYRAIVQGRPSGEGEAHLPLLTARHRPAKVRVASEEERQRARGVRIASLRWRALEDFADATLLEVQPVTGFLHQIRAIFAHLGFPLLGDAGYGATMPDPHGATRHMLHASRVAFEEIRAEAPDAPDFAALLAALRDGNGGRP